MLCCNITVEIPCTGGCTTTFCNAYVPVDLRYVNLREVAMYDLREGTFPVTCSVSSFYKNQTQQMKNNMHIHLSESPPTYKVTYITLQAC